jgi:hypothetical protein
MGREFVDTGYQTHDGQGNVPTGAQWEKGTGYDEHGQVKTAFGKFQLAYDPVTGMAVDNVTSGYTFPAGGEAGGGGGLVDVSAAAQEHGTHATPDMQRQVQEFFARQEAAGAGQGSAGAEEAEAPAPSASGAAEETGQG